MSDKSFVQITQQEIAARVAANQEPAYIVLDRYIVPSSWSPLEHLEDCLDGKTVHKIMLLRCNGDVQTVHIKSYDELNSQFYSGIHQSKQWFCTAPVIAWRFPYIVEHIKRDRYLVQKQSERYAFDVVDTMLDFNAVSNVTSKYTADQICQTLNKDDNECHDIYGRPSTGDF